MESGRHATDIAVPVAEQVRTMILSGAMAPGGVIHQDMLAAEIGISRIPLREALISLQGEGLVTSASRKGYFVSSLSVEEAREIFDLRLKVEPFAITKGAALATDDERHDIEAMLRDMDVSLRDPDLSIYANLNRAFHVKLCTPRCHPLTARIVNALLALSQRYVQYYHASLGMHDEAQQSHEAMFSAWRSGDLGLLNDLVAEHVIETRDRLLRVLEATPPGM